jgi:hypothetical protein
MNNINAAFASLLMAVIFASVTQAQPYSPREDARSVSLLGTWAGRNGGSRGADQYNPDGTYVSVLQLANGTVERIWGVYEARQTAQRQLHVSLSVRGFLPAQICAQAPGFPVQCRPNQVPLQQDADVVFTSPSTFEVNGVTMRRGAGSPLLQMRVPDRLVLAAQAPVQPQMRQPVMPSINPYRTPTGPGSVEGMRQDDQMQQYRICAVNGGQVVKEYGGAVRCVN